MIESILVPRERIRVFNQKVKGEIKKKIDVELKIEGNSVFVVGESYNELLARNFVKAVARGFSPQRAYRLIDEDDTQLEMVDLKDLGEKRVRITKSRVIGAAGKTRGYIERSTGAEVSVYGNTVAIIGKFDEIQNARQAIDMLINGSMHKTVYKFLDQVRR